MTRVLALADHSKIGCITQRRFAKVGTKTHPQRGAALDRNGLSVSTETACRFEPKSPVGNSEICTVVDKEVFSRRTADYQAWVEAFARNHRLPIEWAEKGVRKEDHVLPWQRRMARDDAYGVYFIFKSMEQGPSFRVSVPKYATKDPNYRILARQRSRFTHYYFYLRDETLGPMMMRVA